MSVFAPENNKNIIKATLVKYDNKIGEFARRGGTIRFDIPKDHTGFPLPLTTHVDCITMPQGWKIGTTLDATIKNNEVVRLQISHDQKIDRTQEGLI